MIHPLVADKQRTLRLVQMRHGILSQYGDAVRGNQLRNPVVNLIINMIRSARQHDAVLIVFLQPFDGLLAFSVHCLARFLLRLPGIGGSRLHL